MNPTSRIAMLALALAAPLAGQTNTFPSSGNAGIGTTSPASALQIHNTSGSGYSTISLTNADSGATGGDGLTVQVDGSEDAYLMQRENRALYLGANNQTRVTIAANGKVGVGSTAPAAGLHVDAIGGADTPAFMIENSSYTSNKWLTAIGWNGATFLGTKLSGASGYTLVLSSTGNVGVGTTDPEVALDVNLGSTGLPASSGTAQTSGVFRFGPSDSTLVLDGGGNSGGGFWLQVTGRSDLSAEYPMLLNPNGGNVAIGTTSVTHKLNVNGTVRATEVIVDTGWADHVFADDYALASLEQVEAHIRANRRLPGIPSATDVAQQGISVGEMHAKLLEKVEELTLHLIELKKDNRELAARVHELERKESP